MSPRSRNSPAAGSPGSTSPSRPRAWHTGRWPTSSSRPGSWPTTGRPCARPSPAPTTPRRRRRPAMWWRRSRRCWRPARPRVASPTRRPRRRAERLRYRSSGSSDRPRGRRRAMVGVAQLVERQVVILDVAGSSPVTHPREAPGQATDQGLLPVCANILPTGVPESPVMASIRERPTAAGEPRFVVQFRQNGKQKTETLTRRKDAEKVRDLITALGPEEALARLAGRAAAVGEMATVAQWLDKHVTDLTGVTDRTRADYRAHAARHILPALGALDVDEVTTSDMSRWANELEQRVSPKTVANLRGLLSAAFGYAVEQGLRQDNPMRRLRRTRSGEHERAEMVCLTPQEFGTLRGVRPERWRTFATVLADTGLRFGEAIALSVGDVDLLAQPPAL